ncbi:MAG: hydroxymethylglutaryl-CoA synthase [Chloroflexi bacterium]|nr:MAG: hydroxymethylglutaryl-CoA synthase [Chloroflexota bacterium]RLC96348.1 MAG: hydroxymethylglutaryl-CoA synthase [Chloroflexota bacterium]
MIGITSFGAYIPRYRISRKTINAAMGWFNSAAVPGEKAVANYDEDSVTMAVAAGIDCLNGVDREAVECLYLATVTPPYKERQCAGIVGAALDLSAGIRTADFTDSTKAGTAALLAGCDAVKAGTVRSVLVCGADCRAGKPGSPEEAIYGDGAAAFLVGDSGVIASLEGSYSVSYDFMDRWRAENDRYVHTSEDRWIRDEGYTRFIPEAVSGLLRKHGLSMADVSKVVYPCLYTREYTAIGKGLKLDPAQVQAEMLTSVGDTGTAHPLIGLVAALEEAKPGDRILVASYGFGSDALLFKVTEEIEKVRGKRRGFARHLASKADLTSYEKYLSFRNVVPVEKGMRGETGPTQVTLCWRDRKTILALHGSKCKACGTPQYPAQRVCVNPNCGAIDQMEDYSFADKKGRLYSYTGDSLAFSVSPPEMYGVIDWEGGGRYILDVTDSEPDALKVDMPVEMTFRRRYTDEAHGIYGYFWKATPPRV